MVSTDFNGEPLLILSKVDAIWLLAFMNQRLTTESDSIEFRRVRRKAEETVNAQTGSAAFKKNCPYSSHAADCDCNGEAGDR